MYTLKALTVAAVALLFGTMVSAEPISRTVYHCDTIENPTCPLGYRCCGPISVTLGGTCYLGETGVCPE
ncbi:hypothetical protein GYMLUDRAFT_720737 [Collybiopsis luxurians FD-317 M1]|nr:hypothetical protein GYMLUDRAFT_720737 [Collybiopsis luxurians FD-317 M1]